MNEYKFQEFSPPADVESIRYWIYHKWDYFTWNIKGDLREDRNWSRVQGFRILGFSWDKRNPVQVAFPPCKACGANMLDYAPHKHVKGYKDYRHIICGSCGVRLETSEIFK